MPALKKNRLVWLVLLHFAFSGCDLYEKYHGKKDKKYEKGTYGYDVAFLKKHSTKLIELTGKDGKARLLISPDYQGRVFTSSATGNEGLSYGWINYDLISSRQKKLQFNPVGGEERFWLGPEGGQFSIYFSQGDSFNFEKWQVPGIIDTAVYDLVTTSDTEALFRKKGGLNNYSGSRFDFEIERKIKLLNNSEINSHLNAQLNDSLNIIAYETVNTIRNIGTNDWTKEQGLLSIWLLGMFTPSPQTKVIIPFHPGPDSRKQITDNYFGKIPSDRLEISDSILYFTCDGKYRSKIGLSPSIAKPLAASYDFQNNVLTLVIPEIHKNAPYVNSKWELQKEPFKGDVINSYNDGPLADGSQMGPFYEIESSSPALEVKKGEAASYRQITMHLQGSYSVLQGLVKKILGVDLDRIKK